MLKNLRKRGKSQKAFTLVELVVVIAILSILAAIAVPVITSSMNSARISTMKSNRATVDMLLKEAVNTSKVSLTTVKYNNKRVSEATVEDVLKENNISLDVMKVHKIGSVQYAIKWISTQEGAVLESGTSVQAYDITKKIADIGN